MTGESESEKNCAKKTALMQSMIHAKADSLLTLLLKDAGGRPDFGSRM